MATRIQGGADAFDALRGGIPSADTQTWLNSYYDRATEALSGSGRAFVEKAREMYQVISESGASQLLRNLRSKVDNIWDSNRITPLRTLEALQTASSYNQRWLMANPVLRNLYLRQECEGYGDQYVNLHGDAIGDRHVDYRRVMDGVVVAKPEVDFYYKTYVDVLAEGELKLKSPEKVDVLFNWAMAERFVELGESDPTSQFNAQL